MKYEWKKHAKELYLPKTTPTILEVPEFNFFVIDGKGDPNNEEFADAVGVLYGLAYTIKMFPKKGIVPEGYFEYSVFPLEGIWHSQEAVEILDKSQFVYSVGIRQPDFTSKELAAQAIEHLKKKKAHHLLNNVKFEKICDGLSLQMLHLGAYEDESKSFEQMNEFCEKNALVRTSAKHREIYLTDARKVHKDKLKTVLRYSVKAK